MRSLAVRVSSVKNNDYTKKNLGELRILVLALPRTEIFNRTPDDADAAVCLEKFKEEYSSATGADQQLIMVNTMIRHFASEDQWVLNDELLCQMLSDLHFHAPLKHPIRNAIVKVLVKEATRKRGIIPKSILNTVKEADEALKPLSNENSFDPEAMKVFITSLSGYFENFAEGVVALESYFLTMLQTLRRLIDIYMQILNSDKLSPAKRSEYYVDLHNVVRTVLSCTQQYQSQIVDPKLLEPVLTQCWMCLLDDPVFADLPMDTKINCGILKVFYDRYFQDIFAPREKILTQFETKSILSKDLFYAVAIINTIADKDFLDSNFYVALNVIIDRLIAVGTVYTMDSCIAMAITRALVQFSKKMLTSMRKLVSEIPTEDINLVRLVTQNCLKYVWLNVQHSIDCVRYLTTDLLRNLLRLGHEHDVFGNLIEETVAVTKSNSTNEAMVCLLLDYLSQVLNTERVLIEIPDVQQRLLKNIFKDPCWSNSYERLMLTNCNELNFHAWCDRWIKPLLSFDDTEWRSDFTRLKIVRNLFERAMKTKAEVAEYILAQPGISIEIYLFVLWTMRRSGRKIYAPENYRASADEKVLDAKVHPLDEIRILAFRILIECHKISERFPVEDLNEILEFFRYNCNSQNPTVRQQIATTMKKAMGRLECGYAAAKRVRSAEKPELCVIYETFLRDLIEFCLDWCLFDGANFGRRITGLSTLLSTIETWQKLLPDDRSIYTEKLWLRLQHTLADSYVVNKDAANDILMICWRFYPNGSKLIYDLNELKKLLTTFRPYDTMTAAHYLIFCAFSKSYFHNYYEAIIWCETVLDEGLKMAKVSLMQAARHNALFGSLLSIRHLLGRIDFSKITEHDEVQKWRSFFERFIPKWIDLTHVMAPVVNSSAPEGHLPNDLNDKSHFILTEENLNGQIKLTPQIILLCAWRTVRESSLLMGDIALRTPVITATNSNGLISVDSLLRIGLHFQQLLAETKHRGAFEQTFVGFTNLCLRLWRSNEPELHSCPMRLVRKIAATIGGEKVVDEGDLVLDLKKLCATRRSAGIPFMIQGIVATETQVCSTVALTFCMTTFLNISKTGNVQEARTHSLNILRALFKCTELGEAVSDYISDGIECSIRGYSAASWPERNSSTLLFSSLMTRVFGVQRSKEIDHVSIKNKMTGRVFFVRYPRLYDFFYTELKSASEAIQQNDRPPRLHPLLLIISRLYPSALEGSDSNLKLSTYIPFISTCSSSPELVTRQLSAKSMTALIPSENIAERLFQILDEIKANSALNNIHGYLLQIFYLLRSSKQQDFEIDSKVLNDFLIKFAQTELPRNNVLGRTYLEILLEVLLNKRFHPIDKTLKENLIIVRNRFLEGLSDASQYNQLTQSYVQKPFTIFNLLLSIILQSTEGDLPVINVTVRNTPNELLETQLNIWHLMLLQREKKSFASQDFSRHEIEFVDFLGNDSKHQENVSKLLPPVSHLYYIIQNRAHFYPFGFIKAYEILSLLLAPSNAFENCSDLKKVTIEQLLKMMLDMNNEIDETIDPMWKFINAQLLHHRADVLGLNDEQLLTVVASIRSNTQAFRCASLRRTGTETLWISSMHFAKPGVSLEMLKEYVDLLLMLLRDDDICIRNRTSDIIMDLLLDRDDYTILKKNSKQVIPLAAEDYLLDWFDEKIKSSGTFRIWWDLLKMMNDDEEDGQSVEQSERNDDGDNLIDVEIFEADEQNTFDEAIYTQYKCYKKLVKCVEQSDQNIPKLLNEIKDEFPALHQFIK